MTSIIIRILLVLVLIFNIAITILCSITGENLYKKYKIPLLLSVVVFISMVVAIYISLALLGVGG